MSRVSGWDVSSFSLVDDAIAVPLILKYYSLGCLSRSFEAFGDMPEEFIKGYRLGLLCHSGYLVVKYTTPRRVAPVVLALVASL